MKILLEFKDQTCKSEVISPFLSIPECIADEKELTIPSILKINYEHNIKCFCLNFSVAEKILSNICNVESSDNIGKISFPSSLKCASMQTKIRNFESVMELCSTGKVEYINTENKKMKAVVTLSKWIKADIIVNGFDAFINLIFIDYEINTIDNSASKFCERVKVHPLISANGLNEYFDFGESKELKPITEYVCFWKIIKHDNGYKKYSNFINESKDIMNISYDNEKKYKCEFEGGKIEFKLSNIGDKYPKKVIIKMEEANINILRNLQKQLNLNSIDLIAKVSNIKISSGTLLNKMNFYKDEEFFIFTNQKESIKITYDIYNNIMNIKQEIKLQDIKEDSLINAKEKIKLTIDDLIKNSKNI